MKKLFGIFFFLVSSHYVDAAVLHSYNLEVESHTLIPYSQGKPPPAGMLDAAMAAVPVGSAIKIDVEADLSVCMDCYISSDTGGIQVYLGNQRIISGTGSSGISIDSYYAEPNTVSVLFFTTYPSVSGLPGGSYFAPETELVFGSSMVNGIAQIDFDNLLSLKYKAWDEGTTIFCLENGNPAYCSSSYYYNLNAVSAVPLPGAILLFVGSLLSLLTVRLKRLFL